jgi:hypothetical protein
VRHVLAGGGGAVVEADAVWSFDIQSNSANPSFEHCAARR